MCCLLAVLLSFTLVEKDEKMDLGIFSMSLNVKDIAVSKAFYEKLGFTALEGAGSVEEKWIIMKHGTTKLGLFQDMFPKNTITFSPKDGRAIHNAIKDDERMKLLFSNGLDESNGPCSFSFLDPDGNPILVDQH
jgi:catechol 2,3-dioxygenase-like lactoylglutathione lyase family enzyme